MEKPHLRTQAICGHRKIGYITGVPSRWLTNFPVDYDSINLRMRRALDGRGSHSFRDLKEFGEAFAHPVLLVFVLSISGGIERCVQPMNLRCQDSADLPMERWRAFETCASHLQQIADQIQGVRVFLREPFLIAPYIADQTRMMRRFWYCFAVSNKCSLLHAAGRWHLLAH